MITASWLSMAVSGGDAAFAESGQDGGGVDAQVFANSREGPAKVVEMDSFVDLLWRQPAPPLGDLVSVEDVAHRAPFDAELVAQLVHGRSGSVAGDEFLDLGGIELARSSWRWPVDK